MESWFADQEICNVVEECEQGRAKLLLSRGLVIPSARREPRLARPDICNFAVLLVCRLPHLIFHGPGVTLTGVPRLGNTRGGLPSLIF
jgi:hypothetical protein